MAENVIVPGVVTTETMKQAGIDTVDISTKVSQIRPSRTPLDTILRKLPSQKAGDWVFKFYEDPSRSNILTVQADVTIGSQVVQINLGDGINNVVVGETLKCESSLGDDGNNQILLVVEKNASAQTIGVIATNGTPNASDPAQTTVLPISNGEILRVFGTAYGEEEAKAPALQTLPENQFNHCQLHMAQVEETVFEALNTTKEIDYGMLDFMANKLYDFKKKIEQTSLFGSRSKVLNPVSERSNKYVYASGGLIQFVGFKALGVPNLDKDYLIGLGKDLFADNNGSENRMWFCGSVFMENLMKNADFQKQLEAKSSELVLGVRVSKIDLGFGMVNLVHHKGLNDIGKSHAMFSVDTSNIRKRVYMPMAWRDLELEKPGISRTNAKVLEECFGLEVRNPNTHGYVELAVA